MDGTRLITAIYHDKPGVKYENSPPPTDDSEDDFEAPFFIYPRPQIMKGVKFIKVDRSLFPKSLVNDGKEEEEVSIETARENESIEGRKGGSYVEVLRNQKNAVEPRIDKSKTTKENLVDNAASGKKIKQEILENEESTVILKKKKEKRKNGKKKKSRSKSYSGTDSDTEFNDKHRSKSSTSHKNSHSKKSSHHKKSSQFSVKQEASSDSGEIHSDDEDLSANFVKKAEISVKEEVLSDIDDYRREKRKNSKSSKQKYNDVRSYDDCSYYDSKKYIESRSRDDSRRRDSRNYKESRNRFEESQSSYDSRNRDDSRKDYSDYSSDEDRNRHDDLNYSSRNYKSYMKREMKQEIKQEPGSTSHPPSDWFCTICKLQLNSETTYYSHMVGKKHKKMQRQLSEQEVAKSSVLEITESKKFPKEIDKEQIELHDEVSYVHEACEDPRVLILGLDFVREVRRSEGTKYFCELCSAQCVADSIINHLNGFKHRKNCMKEYCPRNYRYIKDLEKSDSRAAEREIERNLRDVIRFRGKGRIRVFQEFKRRPRSPEAFNPYKPSTSRQNLLPADVPGKKIDDQKVTDEECLSRDFSDFYCKVCDSHMNNYSMWESHARGKKHAKNKKKAEEGLAATSNYIEAPPGTISHLEEMINEDCGPDDIIVGLKFIRENQGENGDLYNCFLCGSVCPTIDIIDHLYLRKHKTKYLEKMLSDGHPNLINGINMLHVGDVPREALIDAECVKMLANFGRGRPVICIAKR